MGQRSVAAVGVLSAVLLSSVGTTALAQDVRPALGASPSPDASPGPWPVPSLEPSGLPVPFLLIIATTLDEPGLFDRATLSAPSGTEVTVRYDNQVPIPHNIAFFAGDSTGAPLIARTDVAGGPGVQEVTFVTPDEPGAYLYVCQVHPAAMTGRLVTTGAP